jgi:hypothetical protein
MSNCLVPYLNVVVTTIGTSPITNPPWKGGGKTTRQTLPPPGPIINPSTDA